MKLNFWKSKFYGLMYIFLLGFVVPGICRADDYLLQPGDVLSVMIIGPAQLQQTVPIEMDGTAWFPIIGGVEAHQKTLAQLRETVANAYSVTSLPVASSTEIIPQLIHPSQIHLSMAAYRPVYVYGDLPQPQTIEFQPGLTLRRLFVLASARDLSDSTAVIVSERHDALTLNLAQALARVWSLKTLLGTDTPEDYRQIFVGENAAIDQIVELEKSLIASRTEETERESRRITTNIQRARLRLVALEKQKANQEEGLELDEKLVTDLRALSSKGLTVASRLAEVRRAALSSASGVLQVDATIEEVRSELAFLEAEAEAVQVGAQSELLEDLSTAIGDVYEARAELATLRATVAANALSNEQVLGLVTRNGKALSPIDLSVSDKDLLPGDLVEIVITSSEATE